MLLCTSILCGGSQTASQLLWDGRSSKSEHLVPKPVASLSGTGSRMPSALQVRVRVRVPSKKVQTGRPASQWKERAASDRAGVRSESASGLCDVVDWWPPGSAPSETAERGGPGPSIRAGGTQSPRSRPPDARDPERIGAPSARCPPTLQSCWPCDSSSKG